MRSLVAMIMLLTAAAAFADQEARQGADWVRITALPCKNDQVLQHLTAAGENPLDYRGARAEYQGKPFNACWKPMYERQVIYLRYEDGDQGLVPFRELQPVKEV